MLVISNRPSASRSADLKLLARLLPELYSTRSNYYYECIFLGNSSFDEDDVTLLREGKNLKNELQVLPRR